MRCWALRALTLFALDVLPDDVELDESDSLLMPGGGPGGEPPAGVSPCPPSDGLAFLKYDDNSDSVTLPSPFVSNALNSSSGDDVLLLEDVLLLFDVLLDAA
jgi:hypothetical protein